MSVSSECWWEILHNGHHAWFQRRLMAGDFRPGLTPSALSVVDADGRLADPDSVPACATCEADPGVVNPIPNVEDLDAVERLTGKTGFLAPYRSGWKPRPLPWPPPSGDPAACWHCNTQGPVGLAKLCDACLAHMESTSPRPAPPVVTVPDESESQES